MPVQPDHKVRRVARAILATVFGAAGVLHLTLSAHHAGHDDLPITSSEGELLRRYRVPFPWAVGSSPL